VGLPGRAAATFLRKPSRAPVPPQDDGSEEYHLKLFVREADREGGGRELPDKPESTARTASERNWSWSPPSTGREPSPSRYSKITPPSIAWTRPNLSLLASMHSTVLSLAGSLIVKLVRLKMIGYDGDAPHDQRACTTYR
jgi:hypothetical protein